VAKDQIQIVFPTPAIVAAITSAVPGTTEGEAERLAEQIRLQLGEANDDCLIVEEEETAASI